MILKLHGAVDRLDQERDSHVITEDDYIDYIARIDIEGLIPPTVLKKLRHSNFLFLAYSLRDWNVRAIVLRPQRLRAERRVQRGPHRGHHRGDLTTHS